MKPTTQQIKDWIHNEELQIKITNIFLANPDFVVGEVNIGEAKEILDFCLENLENLIVNEEADKISHNRRTAILNNLSNISKQIDQAKQYNNNLTTRSVGSNIFTYIHALKDVMDVVLLQHESSFYNYENEVTELSRIKNVIIS